MIKKYSKKIIVISCIVIALFSVISNCFAFEIGTKNIKKIKDCHVYMSYKGVSKMAHYTVFEKDGKQYPAYCLNPEYSGSGSGGNPEYSVNCTNKLQDEKIWKVLINGYPYKTLDELNVKTEEEAYTATQFAIYTIQQNRNTADYTPVNSDEGRRAYQAFVQIVEAAKSSNESINLDTTVSVLSENEKWEKSSDEKNIEKTFYLNTNIKNGFYKIEIPEELQGDVRIVDIEGNEKNEFNIGEKFKILTNIEDIKEQEDKEIIENIKLSIEATLNTKPIGVGITSIPKTQNYALTGYEVEKELIEFNEEVDWKPEVIKDEEVKKEENIIKEIEPIKTLPVTGY